MAQKDFFKNFVLAQNKERLVSPQMDSRKFEMDWSIDYLQRTVFRNWLQGKEAFWHEFNSQLDVALVPINILMSYARRNQFLDLECIYAGPDA